MEDLHLEAAERERAELLQKIDQFGKRVAELETFIRVAGTLSVHLVAAISPPKTAARGAGPTQKPATFKDQVIALTEEMLTAHKWMKTKDIVAGIEKSGVTINTAGNKVVRISAILVKEKDKFSSNRKKGWTLRQARIDSPKVRGLNARASSHSGLPMVYREQTPLAALARD
jgi:hypothetical protein